MTVAVTGATGHVGINLVRALRDQGREVRALALDGFERLDGLDVSIHPGDVRDSKLLREVFAGADIVYHLAAVISIHGDRGGLVHSVNVDGAQASAEAALTCGVRRFIHFSSVHAFDQRESARAIDETTARSTDADQSAYNHSKALGEAAVRQVFAQGLDGFVLHPTAVFGPTDSVPSRLGTVLQDVFRGRMPIAIDGAFDYVDVRDIVDTAIRAETLGTSNESYILSGHWQSTRDLFKTAAEVAAVSPPFLHLPLGVLRPFARLTEIAAGLLSRETNFTTEALDALQCAPIDGAKARRDLQHNPRPIEETLRDLHAWYQSR